MFRLTLFLAVAFGLPAGVVGSVVYHRLTSGGRASIRHRVLLAVATVVGWVIIVVPWPDRPDWLELPGRVLPPLVLVAAITFAIVRFSWPAMKWHRRVLVSVLTGSALVGIGQTWALDGFDGTLRLLILGDHTEYARSYSTSGFRQIYVGMTLHEVVGLLGPPLDEWRVPGDSRDRLYWRWTRSRDGSDDFRVRVVTFLAGRVEERSSYVHLD